MIKLKMAFTTCLILNISYNVKGKHLFSFDSLWLLCEVELNLKMFTFMHD